MDTPSTRTVGEGGKKKETTYAVRQTQEKQRERQREEREERETESVCIHVPDIEMAAQI